jgi:hypothetical protein
MKSIHRHITIWLMGAVLLLATVANAILYLRVRTALRREYDRRLMSDARALSRLIAIIGTAVAEPMDRQLQISSEEDRLPVTPKSLARLILPL